MSVGLGTAIGYLKLDVSGFAHGIDSAISDMNRLNDNFSTASKGLQTIGGMFSKTGTVLSAGLTAPVVGFGAASIKAGTDFDTSMSQVSAVSKATGEDLEIIRDRAIEMGEKTRYSAKEVSDAMYYMGLASWDAQQIYEGIPGVLALGAASGEDLSRVSDIVTDSLTAFGKTAEDTTEFVNVLAEASRSSNTTVDMLGESFKYVGPVAGAFGYSIQDTATVLGIFANNGVKSSQAGTGLRQALNSLINPSEKAATLMDEYGVSLFNADGSTKSLMTVCEELRETFGGLAIDIHNADGEVMEGEEILEKYGHSLPSTEMEKLSAIVKIFGVRALPGMLSVINASDESFYGLAEAINGAQDAYDGLGTAFGMQETMMNNLQGDWYKFTSALGTTKILISDMAKGALRDLVQRLTELVNKFNEMDPAQREQIVKWAMIVASIGPVLVIIGKLISGIGSMITMFKTIKDASSFVVTTFRKVSTAFTLTRDSATVATSGLNKFGVMLGSITGPMIAITALIAALVAAFVDLWNSNEEFRNKIIEIWNGIKAKFEEAGQRIVEIFNELGFSFEDFEELMEAAIEWLGKVWDGFCELLAPVFVGAFEIIGDVISGIVDLFVGVIEIITGIVKGFKDGDWSMLWEGIGDVVVAVVDTIVNVFDHLAEMIWNVIQTIANWFGADWSMSWDEAKEAVGNAVKSIIQFVSNMVQKVGQFFSKMWQTIKNICQGIWNTIVSIWNGIVNAVSTVLNVLWNVISGIFNGIWNTITGIMQHISNDIVAIWNTIKGLVTTIVNAIGTFLSNAWNNIKNVVVNIVTSIKDTIVGIFTGIKNAIVNIITGLLNIISSIFNGIKTVMSDAIIAARDNVINVVVSIRDGIVNVFTKIKDVFVNIGSNIINGLKEGIEAIKNGVINVVTGIRDGIVNIFDKVKDVFVNIGSNIINGLGEGIESVVTTVVNGVINIKNKIIDIWKKIKDKFIEIGKNIIEGIKEGIEIAADGLFSLIGTKIDVSMVEKMQDDLDIHSPSRVMKRQIGRWLPPGIAEGFVEAMPAAIKEIEDSLNDGIDDIEANDIDTGNTNLEAQITDFIDVYKQLFEGLVIWFETMEDRMTIAIENLTEYFRYMLYVRQILNDDNKFRTFVLGGNESNNKPGRSDNLNISDTPNNNGGDVFNFYSPKPINEVQAARMLKNAKRDLAEGF